MAEWLAPTAPSALNKHSAVYVAQHLAAKTLGNVWYCAREEEKSRRLPVYSSWSINTVIQNATT